MERKFRITASRFGEICKATSARNFSSLCASIYNPPVLTNPAVMHGIQNEKKALKLFTEKSAHDVQAVGLYIDPSYPFLGATPDGLIEDDDSLIEVKCPFQAKDSKISEETVPYLTATDGNSSEERSVGEGGLGVVGALWSRGASNEKTKKRRH